MAGVETVDLIASYFQTMPLAGDVAVFRGVEAHQPAELHPVERLLRQRHVEPAVVEDRHRGHLIGRAVVLVVGLDPVLGLGQGMAVESPDVLQQQPARKSRPCRRASPGPTSRTHRYAVAGPEEPQRPPAHFARGHRTPLAVGDVETDAELVPGDQLAGVLVEHDHAGRFGVQHAAVRPLDAVGRADVEQVALDQHRAVGRRCACSALVWAMMS